VFWTWLAAPDGQVAWRSRSDDLLSMVIDRLLLASRAGDRVVCRSLLDGSERWARTGRLQAIVDDTAWLIDDTNLVGYGLERGDQRATIPFGMVGASMRVDRDGRGHLQSRSHYWTVDLRNASVLTRYRCTNPPHNLSSAMPVNDGLLVGGSDRALYYFPALDGEGPLPEPIWRSKTTVSSLWPHRNGLVVIEDPTGEPMNLKWLAPA
jgi:hypothetical protein